MPRSLHPDYYPLNLRIGAGLMARIMRAVEAGDYYRRAWIAETIADAIRKGLKAGLTVQDLRDISNGKKLTQIEIETDLLEKAKKKAASDGFDLTTWISIACAQRAK